MDCLATAGSRVDALRLRLRLRLRWPLLFMVRRCPRFQLSHTAVAVFEQRPPGDHLHARPELWADEQQSDRPGPRLCACARSRVHNNTVVRVVSTMAALQRSKDC